MRIVHHLVLGLILTFSLSAAGLTAGGAGPEPAAAPGAAPDVASHLGRWNYDQPDRDRGINIAELRCPVAEPGCASPFPHVPAGSVVSLPQVGGIVLTQAADGTVIGRTDQGCTWQFVARQRSLELHPAPQYCLNPTIRSGYTLTSWTITAAGRRAREAITGISHHPSGDYEFVLDNGRRTRAEDRSAPDPARRFVGTWTYDSADPAANVNVGILRTAGPDGAVQVRSEPQTGSVTLTSERPGALSVHTRDGCRWTFAVSGNTAVLDPAGQTCRVAGEVVEVVSWTMASDGRRQASIFSANRQHDGVTSTYVLTGGALTRR